MSETLVSQPRHHLVDNPGGGRNGGQYVQNGAPYSQNGAPHPHSGAHHETPARVITQKKSEITVADSNPMAARGHAGGASNGANHVVSPKTAANIKEMVDGGAEIPESLLYANDQHVRTSHVAAHAGPTSNALLAGRRHAPIVHQRKPSDDSVISDISSNSKQTFDRNSGSPNQPYSVPDAVRGTREGVALKPNGYGINNTNNGNNDYYRQTNGAMISPRDRPPIGGGGGGGAAAPLSPSYVQLERQAANKQNGGVRADSSQQPYYQQQQPQYGSQQRPQQHQQQDPHHRLHVDTSAAVSPVVDYHHHQQQAHHSVNPYQAQLSPSPSNGYYSTPLSPQQQQQQHHSQASPPHGQDHLPRPSGQSRRSAQRRNSDSDSVTSEASGSVRSGHSHGNTYNNGVKYPPAYQQQQAYPSPHAGHSPHQQQQQQPYPVDHLPRPSGSRSSGPSGSHHRRPSDADSVASDTSSLRSGGHHNYQQQQQQYQHQGHNGQHHQHNHQYDQQQQQHHPQQQHSPLPPHPYNDRPLPNPHYSNNSHNNHHHHQQQQPSPHSRAAPPPPPSMDDVPRNSLGQRLNPEYRSLAVRGSPALHQNEDAETDDDEYMTAHDLRRASGKLDFASVYDPHAREAPSTQLAERPNMALDLMPLRERVLNQRPQGPAVANDRLQQDDSEKRHDWNRHNTVSMSKIYGHVAEEEDQLEGMPEEGFSDKVDANRPHHHHHNHQQQHHNNNQRDDYIRQQQQSQHRHGGENGSNLSQTTAESLSDRVPHPTQKSSGGGNANTAITAEASSAREGLTSEKASTLCEYEPPPALSTITKAQQSRETLAAALKRGIVVVKHGRHGAPKKKILTCDQDCDHLYWRDDNGLAVDPKYHASLQDSRGLTLSDVKQIRMGGEIDPTSIPEDYAPKKKTLTETLFGHHKDEGIKYGTATLRKHCKEADLLVSFSLIMNDRTFDIQCLNKKDYNLLYSNLFNIINDDHSFALLPKTMPPLPKLTAKSSILITSPGKAVEQRSERKGRRKSVTFSDGQAAASVKEGENGDGGELGPRETYSDKVAAAAAAAVDRQISKQSSFESESDKFNTSFSGEAVYELDDSDNYDLLLQPLANYSATSAAKKKDTVHPAALKGAAAGGPGGAAAAAGNYKGYKEYNKFLAELADEYDDDSDDADEQRKESRKKTDMHTLLNSSQERIVISPGMNSRSSSPGGAEVGVARISSNEAMEIGLLLSQQEAAYGINMYDSLKTTDAPELDRLMRVEGLSTEMALLRIFNKRFDPRHQGLINMQNRGDMGMAPIATATPVNNYYGGSPMASPQMGGGLGAGGGQRTLHRMTSSEALQIGLMLSKQEAEYGTNMYESLTQADDAEISRLCRQQGFSEDEAVLEVFNRKYVVNYRGGRPGSSPFGGAHQQPSYQNPYATAEVVRGGYSPATVGMDSPSSGGMRNPRNTKAGAIHRMNSTDGMNLMLLISQQEAEHGTNMYDSMVVGDEAAVMELMDQSGGRLTHEQAVQTLFEKRYRSRPGGIAINSPPRGQQRGDHQQAPDFGYLPPPPGGQNANWQNTSYSSAYSSASNEYGPPPSTSNARARPIQRIQSSRDDSTGNSASPSRTPSFFSNEVVHQYGSPNGNAAPPLDPHSNSKMSSGGRKGHDLTPEATAVTNSKRSPSPVVATPASPGVPVVERKRSIFSLNKQKSGVMDGSAGTAAPSIQYREKDVRQIMSLGYVREQAVSALVECDNNVQRAIQLLAGS